MRTKTLLSLLCASALWATSAQAGTSAPTILCPRPVVAECASTNGTPVTVTAILEDIDGDALTAVWWVNGQPVQTNDVAASDPLAPVTLTLTYAFPAGTNLVAIRATDGETDPVGCRTTVTVQDTTAPVIRRLTANPKILWPPNHKMILVRFNAQVTDACGPTRTRIVGIRSNEPVEGKGDGNTTPDWVIAGRLTAYLRAERSGRGDGRIYSVTVECRDEAGNASRKTVQVKVPHDLGRTTK
jgi:hypothetical protein